MIRSETEKNLIVMITSEEEKDERLRYVTVNGGNEFDDEVEVVFPDEMREEILNRYWIFNEKPKMNEKMYDLHSDRLFLVKDYRLIYYQKRHIIVSPYYFEKGGTILDFLDEKKYNDKVYINGSVKYIFKVK